MSLQDIACASSREFRFSETNYIFKADWHDKALSFFDSRLQELWLNKEELFRYKFKITESKNLTGTHGFLAQLNIDRATLRREPVDIQSTCQPFCSEKFNFTKIPPEEVLFSLVRELSSEEDLEKDFFLINVSPLEMYHSLLVPRLFKCLNQMITKESLIMAVNTILLSGTPEMRVGFNSLCAYASVNHLHFHAYYLNVPMKLETVKVNLLSGRCYALEEYPAKGFVFQLACPADIPGTVNDVFRLTRFLNNENIAHNLYMSRGLKFERSATGEITTERDVIRIYVWARVSSCGAKVPEAFNPALCELFGHIVVKTKEAFDNLVEENVASILYSITHDPFTGIKERVKELFEEGASKNELKK